MTFKQLALSGKFVLALGATCLVLVAGLLISLQWPVGGNGLIWLISLNKVFSEMLLVIACSLLLFSVWWPIRILSGVLFTVYALTLFTQITSLQFSSEYLAPIALENAQHVDFIFDSTKLGWLVIVFMAVFVTALNIRRTVRPIPSVGSRSTVAIALVVLAVLVKNDERWISDHAAAKRFDFYNSGRASIRHQAPGSAMVDTLKLVYETKLRERWIEQASVELPEKSALFAYEFGIQLNESDTDYPLLKSLEFERPPTFLKEENWQAKNVIVFFVEGMSSRIIQPYTQYFPDISPNFENFSEHAIVVDDYYSHSYATYRGLSGQFCSIYANGRLSADTNYYCLPHVLSDNGFDTHFFVSQSLAKTDLDEVATRAGFANVHGSKELAKYIPDDAEMSFDLEDYILYDTSFVESFKRWMTENEARVENSSSDPFFAALYNFQTHTGVRLNSDVKYLDPTGKSSSYVLDTFHNFDMAFGNFWEYFKGSPYYKNTIVVVTTDHATFGSNDFARLVRDTPGYVQLFADKIPLMIYHPNAHASRFSARGASSVNLAPSLLHTLNVNVPEVPFFGSSIFDESNVYPKPLVASSGISYSNVGGRHWVRQVRERKTDIPPSAKQAKPFHDLILFTQGLERDNRLTPRDK